MQYVSLNAKAIAATLGEWQAKHPGMGVLAFLPEAEKDQVPLLQACCRAADTPLVGAIFPSLIHGGQFVTEGTLLLRLDGPPRACIIEQLGQDARADAQRISAAIAPLLPEAPPLTPALFLIFDAMVPNIGSLLDGLYLELADRVSYAGVNGGSETFQPMPCLFDGDASYQNAVLAVLLADHPGSVMAHAYPIPKHLVTATSTEGNRINSLNWQPAFEMYQQLISSEYGIDDLNQDNFYQYASHFPFGILRADNEVVVRIPVAITDDGALYCVGEVPANAALVLLRAPEPGNTQCIQELTTLLSQRQQATGGPLLLFYCAGRRMHLGPDAQRELQQLQQQTGAQAIMGALSLGEIGSSGGWEYPCFHNATIVATPWAQG